MNLNLIHSFRVLMLGLGVCCAAACQEDDTDPTGSSLRFRNDDATFACAAGGGDKEIVFYSRCGHWEIVADEASSEWLSFWPAYGDDNGRTVLTVKAVDDAYGRKATLRIVSDRYGEVGRIEVDQSGMEPYIRLDLSAGRIKTDIVGTPVLVGVESNVQWTASVVEGDTWISLGETTPTSQEFRFTDNTGQPRRSGLVRFSMTGGDYFVDVPVEQQDGNTTYEQAVATTVADLLALVELSEGRFELEENLRLDAWITSDHATRNMPDSVLFVQDASGKGLRIQLKDRSEIASPSPDRAGWYDAGRLVSLHLYGAEFREDGWGNLAIVDFTCAASVKSSAQTPPPADLAVALTDFSGLDAHANTLVRIDPVEFMFPYGCYVNSSETADYVSPGSSEEKTLWWYWDNQTSDRYKQRFGSFMHYPNYLRDARGEGVPVLFHQDFTEKWSRDLPTGSGAFTGIVSKYRDGVVLFMRNVADDALGNDPATRLGHTLLKAGPWTDNTASVPSIEVGNAGDDRSSLRYSVESAPGDYGFVTGGTGAYWVQGGRYRMHFDTPFVEDGPQYYAANARNWWNNNVLESSVATAEAPGEAFVLRTNVLRNATGALYISFTTSSSLGGPGLLRLQWTNSTDDDLRGAAIHDIADYGATAFDYSPYLWQWNIRLPDEMKGREVSILFRCVANDNARLEEKLITAGGTTRIGSIEIVEIR